MKKLPKVIRRDLRPSPTRPGKLGEQAPTTPSGELPSADGEPGDASAEPAEASAETERAIRRDPRPSRTRPGTLGGQAPTTPLKEPTSGDSEPAEGSTERAEASAETAAVPAAPTISPQPQSNDAFAARRRALAYKMVERYSVFAGGAGIIPIAIVSLGGVMGVNVRMVQILCKMYGIPFQRDRARAIVVGLVGGATPVGIAAATASTLVYFTPATSVIALVVSSAMAIACTRRIGRIFVDRFETGRGVE
jgi:uncharacterized protein (DUF697 family)